MARILNSWKSLTSITLAGNLWDCGRNVCALASWLSNFQGRYDGNLQCASPEYISRSCVGPSESESLGILPRICY